MRPPWFEAAPALAAAGLPLSPDTARHAAVPTLWSHPMIDTARYAFLPRLDAVTKPFVFNDLSALARHIERARTQGGDPGLQLEEVEDLQFAGDPGLHRGVQVWLLDLANERERALGYAWLRGDGRDVLEPALRAARRHAARAAA